MDGEFSNLRGDMTDDVIDEVMSWGVAPPGGEVIAPAELTERSIAETRRRGLYLGASLKGTEME